MNLLISKLSQIVTWEPPKVKNGELTNYIVKASLISDDPELLEQRNYCEERTLSGKIIAIGCHISHSLNFQLSEKAKKKRLYRRQSYTSRS